MGFVSVSIDGRMISEAIRKLDKWQDEKRKRIIARTSRAGLNIQSGAKRKITEQKAIDRGRLRAAIHTKASQNGMERTIGVHTEELQAGVTYAGGIEYGTPPHHVPIGPLLGWAKRKHKLGASALDQHRMWAIALGTQKGIAEHGTRARPYLEPAYEEELRDYLIEVGRILRE